MDRSDNVELLASLRRRVEEMGQFGRTADIQRIIDMIGALEQGDAIDKVPLSKDFASNFNQRRAVQSQGFAFGKPEEELAAKLVDFYDGRIDSIETLGASEEVMAAADALASNFIAEHRPFVRIDVRRFSSLDQILSSLDRTIVHLRSNRDELERVIADNIDPDHHRSAFFDFRFCKNDWVVVGPIKIENDTAYEQHCWTSNCGSNDGFGPERASRLMGRTGGNTHCKWVEIAGWKNYDPKKPPLFKPEPWKSKPWSNKCEVFKSAPQFMVSSPFGWEMTQKGSLRYHQGIDIAAYVGTPVYPKILGEVVWVNDTAAKAETGVVVAFGTTLFTYWHIVPQVKIGDTVTTSTVLGTVSKDHPMGAHLHFAQHKTLTGKQEERNEGNAVHPCPGY